MWIGEIDNPTRGRCRVNEASNPYRGAMLRGAMRYSGQSQNLITDSHETLGTGHASGSSLRSTQSAPKGLERRSAHLTERVVALLTDPALRWMRRP